MKKNVRALVMDVDGTLTDGKIHISEHGELFKSFDVKDGFAIANMLPRQKIIPIIITGRKSKMVECRAEELKIEHLYQGVADKAEYIRRVSANLDIPLEQIACIGDDCNDLPMMELCGMRGCPADAVVEVQAVCDYVAAAPGGRGAVREFIEWLIEKKE